MSEVERMLSDKKMEIDELQVPEELEGRLNNALQTKASVKRRGGWKLRVAVLVIAFVLVTYNADTLAFYGKELLGFDNIMSGTLKELNKMGMGQTIDKSYTFSNGVEVTLNGVMADDNQLLAFYTIVNPGGNVEEVQLSSDYMKGAVERHYPSSAQGELSQDKSKIKWVGDFDPPFAFEKELTWMFAIVKDGKREEGKISFVLDREKAMGHTLKSRLNKTVKLDGATIQFNLITASPTTTVINGTIQNIFELAKSQVSGERIFSPSIDVRLLADGREVAAQGWGASTTTKGMKFETRYDALPRDLKMLQLHILRFGAEHEVNEQVMLNHNDLNRVIQVKGQGITINQIEEVNGEIHITITTDDSVVLSKVFLLADDNSVELTETIEGQRDKNTDGTITHTRTLSFKAAGKDLKLDIKRIRYEQACDQYIDIPID